MPDETEQLWDRDEIAVYLKCSVNSVNSWLIRNGVPVAGHGAPQRGRVKNLYAAIDVRRAKETAPGRGNPRAR